MTLTSGNVDLYKDKVVLRFLTGHTQDLTGPVCEQDRAASLPSVCVLLSGAAEKFFPGSFQCVRFSTCGVALMRKMHVFVSFVSDQHMS